MAVLCLHTGHCRLENFGGVSDDDVWANPNVSVDLWIESEIQSEKIKWKWKYAILFDRWCVSVCIALYLLPSIRAHAHGWMVRRPNRTTINDKYSLFYAFAIDPHTFNSKIVRMFCGVCDAFIHEIYYAFLIDSIRFRDILEVTTRMVTMTIYHFTQKNQIVSVCQFTHTHIGFLSSLLSSTTWYCCSSASVFLPARWHVLKTNKSELRFMDSKNGIERKGKKNRNELNDFLIKCKMYNDSKCWRTFAFTQNLTHARGPKTKHLQ